MHPVQRRICVVLFLLFGVTVAQSAQARPKRSRTFDRKKSNVVRIQTPRALRPRTPVRVLKRSHGRAGRRGAYVMVNRARTWKCRRVRDRRTGKARRVCGRRVTAKTPPPQTGFPAMPLYNYHTNEILKLRLYSTRGHLRPAALRRFTRFMRYHRTGVAVPIHWRVPVVLYEIWTYFGQPQITVFSGHRPKQACELKTSKHIIGKAVDFKLDRISNAAVRNYLLKHGFKVGIGYYPNAWHIHVDVRGKKGFWIDYSRRGERAMYALHPYRALRTGLGRTGYRPGRARQKTANVKPAVREAKQAAREAKPPVREAKQAAREAKPAVREAKPADAGPKRKPVLAQTQPLPPPGAPPLTPNPPSPGPDPASRN